MAEFKFANAANVIGKAEQIKGQRLRNSLLGMGIEQQQNIIADQEKYEQIRSQHHAIPQAIEKLRAAGMNDKADELAQSHMQRLQAGVSYIKSVREAVDETNWKDFRQRNIEAGLPPDLFPVEYSEKWLRAEEKKTQAALTKFSFNYATPGGTMTQDVIQRGGDVIAQPPPYKAGSQTRAPKPTPKKTFTPAEIDKVWDLVAKEFGGILYRDPATNEVKIFIEGEESKFATDMAYRTIDLAETTDISLVQAMEEARREIIPGSRPGVTGKGRDPLGLL